MPAPMVQDVARLTTGQLAKRWMLTIGTLQQWRSKGLGPAFVKIGRQRSHSIFYRLPDVLEYENKHTVKARR